jgi:hypothetical protein
LTPILEAPTKILGASSTRLEELTTILGAPTTILGVPTTLLGSLTTSLEVPTTRLGAPQFTVEQSGKNIFGYASGVPGNYSYYWLFNHF